MTRQICQDREYTLQEFEIEEVEQPVRRRISHLCLASAKSWHFLCWFPDSTRLASGGIWESTQKISLALSWRLRFACITLIHSSLLVENRGGEYTWLLPLVGPVGVASLQALAGDDGIISAANVLPGRCARQSIPRKILPLADLFCWVDLRPHTFNAWPCFAPLLSPNLTVYSLPLCVSRRPT